MWLDYKFDTDIASPSIRGVDTPRPWNLYELISKEASPNKILLDIGCGTGNKLIPIGSSFGLVVGLEPNQELLHQAWHDIQSQKINNILLVKGFAEALPFPDNYFDVVTIMLAPHNAAEIYRVLKPNGIVIGERVGDHDKHDLKEMFGKDQNGWRGYLFTENKQKTPFKDQYTAEFNNYFTDVKVTDGFWQTHYSLDNLIKLLEHTPAVRNFNINNDKAIIAKIVKKFSSKQDIVVIQNRILIIARK
jgi:ubiquinone/menaquinone biosynthesis C-methylase UbiE